MKWLVAVYDKMQQTKMCCHRGGRNPNPNPDRKKVCFMLQQDVSTLLHNKDFITL